MKGDGGMKKAIATRIAGSADLYHNNNRCSPSLILRDSGLRLTRYAGSTGQIRFSHKDALTIWWTVFHLPFCLECDRPRSNVKVKI